MAFFEDMAQVVVDLLTPDTQGGLGMGPLDVVRVGFTASADPLEPDTKTKTRYTVQHIGSLDSQYESRGATVRADLAYMITPPDGIDPQVGDRMERDGEDIGGIVHVAPFASNDVRLYFEVYLNR